MLFPRPRRILPFSFTSVPNDESNPLQIVHIIIMYLIHFYWAAVGGNDGFFPSILHSIRYNNCFTVILRYRFFRQKGNWRIGCMVTFFPGGFHIGSSLYKTHTYLSFIDLKLKTSGSLNLVITSDIFRTISESLTQTIRFDEIQFFTSKNIL